MVNLYEEIPLKKGTPHQIRLGGLVARTDCICKLSPMLIPLNSGPIDIIANYLYLGTGLFLIIASLYALWRDR